jgi:hypothetical protein
MRRAVVAALALMAGILVTIGHQPAGAAAPGTWTLTGSTHDQFGRTVATRLPSGKVLIVGGGQVRTAAELYNPTSGTWSPAAAMHDGRVEGETATLLKDGRVLVVGGVGPDAFSSARAEIYDPAKNTWARTGNLHESRFDHVANLLPNGDVLVAGGEHDVAGSADDDLSLDSVEIFHPASGTFSQGDPLAVSRRDPASVTLPSGKVLVIGGFSDEGSAARTAETYDPATGHWSTAPGRMHDGRAGGHEAVVLADGNVLVSGGNDVGRFDTLASAEIFDPTSGTFAGTTPMNQKRTDFRLVPLNDGEVLATGGDVRFDGGPLAEIYDPASRNWQQTATMHVARRDFGATLLGNGKVLVVGGSLSSTRTAELFTPTGPRGADKKLVPKAASGGSVTLVVWQTNHYGDIYGARLDATGKVLDPAGIPISTAPYAQTHPTVAWNGSSFLVAWSDARSGPGAASDIYGTRVTPSGTVLNPNGVPISTAPYNQNAPVARANGSTWLVAWEDGRNRNADAIFGTRVTAAGTVLSPNGFAISATSGLHEEPSLASDGTDWLAVWMDDTAPSQDIRATRITGAGVVANPNGVAVATSADDDEKTPAVAWNGRTYEVVWGQEHRQEGGGQVDVYSRRVDANGHGLAPARPVANSPDANEARPAITGLGDKFLVAWEDDGELGSNPQLHIGARRISSTGEVLQPVTGVGRSVLDETNPAVAINDGVYLVVWSDTRSGNTTDIFGARVRTDGTPQPGKDDFPIAT